MKFSIEQNTFFKDILSGKSIIQSYLGHLSSLSIPLSSVMLNKVAIRLLWYVLLKTRVFLFWHSDLLDCRLAWTFSSSFLLIYAWRHLFNSLDQLCLLLAWLEQCQEDGAKAAVQPYILNTSHKSVNHLSLQGVPCTCQRGAIKWASAQRTTDGEEMGYIWRCWSSLLHKLSDGYIPH